MFFAVHAPARGDAYRLGRGGGLTELYSVGMHNTSHRIQELNGPPPLPPICLLLCIPSLFTLLNIHTVMIKHISQSLTPDDQTFRALASLYATRHKSMFKGNGLCHDDNFPGGFIFFCILIFQNCSVQVVSQMVLNGTL